MVSQLLQAGMLMASALSLASAGPVAVPYSDGSCTKPVESYSYTTKNGTRIENKPFDTGLGVGGNKKAGTLSFVTYSQLSISVPSTSNTLNQKVFWKMNDLPPKCRVIFMRPWSSDKNIPGSIVLNAGNADSCYYTDPKDKIQMSYCCGTEQCSLFNVGLSALNTRDLTESNQPTSGDNNGPSSSLAKIVYGKIPVNNATLSNATSLEPAPAVKSRRVVRSGSIAARALAARAPGFLEDLSSKAKAKGGPYKCGATDRECFNREWKKCKVTVTGQPVMMPGKQMAVSDAQDCTSGSDTCPIKITNTHKYSYEVSVSKSQSDTTGTSSSETTSESNTSSLGTSTTNSQEKTDTNTLMVSNTDGWDLSVTAGVGFGFFSASTTAGTSHSTTNENTNTQSTTTGNSQTVDTFNSLTTSREQTSSQSFSQTVANTTGHAVTWSGSKSISQEWQVMGGAYGYLTFTPQYDCYPVEVDCGEGNYFKWTTNKGNNLHGVRKLKTQVCAPTVVEGEVRGLTEVLYTNRS